MFFEPLRTLADKFIKIDPAALISEIIKEEHSVRTFILERNRKGQLFEKGIDALGKSLGEYSNFTINQKIDDGLPHDRITLFQDGDFYETFDIIIFKRSFEIIADPVKPDSNLFDEFGVDIVGLTEESKELLSIFIKPFLIRKINSGL